jgi:hypothetical protein
MHDDTFDGRTSWISFMQVISHTLPGGDESLPAEGSLVSRVLPGWEKSGLEILVQPALMHGLGDATRNMVRVRVSDSKHGAQVIFTRHPRIENAECALVVILPTEFAICRDDSSVILSVAKPLTVGD